MSLKHMLRANKNELLSIGLAGFLIMNSGFTAPHEVIESAPAGTGAGRYEQCADGNQRVGERFDSACE